MLTTTQVATIGFDNLITARHRLTTLHQLRVLDRFRPFTATGSAPDHWVLDVLGARVLAAHRGITVEKLGYRRDRALGIAHSTQLAHLVGTNGVFAELLSHARTHPQQRLEHWWSARRTATVVGQFVRPDGYGIWSDGTARASFFLEYDRGTETLTRLAEKIPRYERLAAAGWDFPVLFHLPSAAREAHLRQLLEQAHTTARVATTHAGHAHPAEAAWLPHDGMLRRPIAELDLHFNPPAA